MTGSTRHADEIKELRAKLAHARNNLDANREIGMRAYRLAERWRQEAEQLRAALERIVAHQGGPGDAAADWRELARLALGQRHEPDEPDAAA